MPSPFRATYRLQLHPGFDFSAACDVVPYLAELGISHLYLSPIMRARKGSTHGYDVVDHNAINEELGGREGFERLRETCLKHELGIILDFVPNHAGVGSENKAWQDVLAYGPSSSYARLFDIDWVPLKDELEGKVLLPFLGATYGEALENGELKLHYSSGRYCLDYYDNRFALSPASFGPILTTLLEEYEREEPYWDLKDLADAYATLEPRERDKAETLRLRLMALGERVDLSAASRLMEPADLHDVLERQFWRLSYWKTAGHEINYRRFFDINGLAALRMEDDRVFWQAHKLLGELLMLPGVDGVRIDHVDGLLDPHLYLERLRDLGASHVWVEKIFGQGETLPDDWPVEGTTGYRFMNDAVGVLLFPDGEDALDRTYRRQVPDMLPFAEVAYNGKHLVMKTSLSSELYRLAYEFDLLSESDYRTRDFTLEALREALAEIIASMDRYRTYLPHEVEESAGVLREAVERAQRRDPAGERSVYGFIERVLMGDVLPQQRSARRQIVGRFQQYSAPVMAKGVEDTAFYRWTRLAALNEVGGEPDHFGTSPQSLHARARYRARRYPNALLATATHDHKRGEDTRLRIAALSEFASEWEVVSAALADVGSRYVQIVRPLPDDAYLFAQTLAALWHDADRDTLTDRLAAYALKAARESKRHTSWITPDDSYEQALDTYVRGVTTDEATPDILDDLSARLAHAAFAKTISQTLLKLTQPGVPDIYQGTEDLDLSLVDPDNRRPVDFDALTNRLSTIRSFVDTPDADTFAQYVTEQNPLLKHTILASVLALRKRLPDLFAGSYQVLDASEPLIAYARQGGGAELVVVLPRWLPDADTELSVDLPDGDGVWRCILTGEEADGPSITLATPMLWRAMVRESR